MEAGFAILANMFSPNMCMEICELYWRYTCAWTDGYNSLVSAEQLMAEFDSDGDCCLNFEEFVLLSEFV